MRMNNGVPSFPIPERERKEGRGGDRRGEEGEEERRGKKGGGEERRGKKGREEMRGEERKEGGRGEERRGTSLMSVDQFGLIITLQIFCSCHTVPAHSLM